MKVLLVLLCMSSLSFAAEFDLSNSQKIFIPDTINKDDQLRGVLVIRNYGGMSGLYNKKPDEWRAFLVREKFAMLLFTPKNGVGKKDDVSSAVGKSDIVRLDHALLEAEKTSGFKNLKGLPFIPFGISRGGANSLMMAAASSKRAIAAVAHHGESGVGITLKKMPVLYTHAQFEPVKNKRNLKIDRWLQAIHGKSGVYYSTIIHKGFKHGSYGTGEFALQWVKEVVLRRLDKKGKIQKVSKDGSFFATYKIEGEETPSSKFINCAIQENKSSKCKMWMPSKDVAELWLKLMKKQEK